MKDGKVVSMDAKEQLMKLEYEDGSTAFVDMSPRSVKNSGGGFYITAQLEPNPGVKVGAKFKAGDVLAHDRLEGRADPLAHHTHGQHVVVGGAVDHLGRGRIAGLPGGEDHRRDRHPPLARGLIPKRPFGEAFGRHAAVRQHPILELARRGAAVRSRRAT